MIKYIYALLALLLSFSSFSQDVTASYELTDEITVCQEEGVFQTTLINYTGGVLENPIIQVVLPEGILYIPESMFELTSKGVSPLDVASSENLQFSLDDIPVGDSVTFRIKYTAKIPAVNFQKSGGVFRNQVNLIHDAGVEFNESDSYNILFPALNIINLSPTSQTVVSGDTTTRSYEVLNAGFGRTDEVYIVDVFSAGASLLEVNAGTLSGDTLYLNSDDFLSVGNGDGFLDHTESIVLTEKIVTSSCVDITSSSTLKTFWGCEDEWDISSNVYAHVSVDFQSPSLTLTALNQADGCFGADLGDEQTLVIVNTGDGYASNISLDVFKSSGDGMDETIYARIEEASFKIREGWLNSPEEITPELIYPTTADDSYACLGVSPTGRVILNLPNIAPGDSLIVTWEMFSCCIDVCENWKIQGWKAIVDYSDICEFTDYNGNVLGQEINEQYMTVFTETPTEISNESLETYNFTISSFKNTLPSTGNSRYIVSFELENGLVYESLAFTSNGALWEPESITYTEEVNLVEAVFNIPEPFILPKSEINLTLSGLCGTPGWKEISMSVAYDADYSCESDCLVPLICDEVVTTRLHCPLVACEGLYFHDFDVERISLGSPDNDANGIADLTGEMDPTKIKLNRAMVGDTIQTIATGVVMSELFDTWEFGSLMTTNSHGNHLEYIQTTVKVYDQSEGIIHIIDFTDVETTISGESQTFKFNLSIDYLSAINPDLSALLFSNGDSIIVVNQYQLISSVEDLIAETLWENDFYLSDVPEPSAEDKFQCDNKAARSTFIGYSFLNDFPSNHTVRSCSNNIVQNFGMSIGDCCNNYAGGNLFPYEYRSWGNLKEVKVVIPENYTVVNSFIRQFRTRKTNSSATETLSSIIPDAINGDTLYYNIENYYAGGEFSYSDDGFYGLIRIELAPSCDVPQDVFQPVKWYFNYQKSNAIDGEETDYIDALDDQIRYLPSDLELSSASPWVDANQKRVEWNVKVKNVANADADYTWLFVDAPENITIVDVYNENSGEYLDKVNGLFLVGTVEDYSTTNLTLSADIESCDTLLFQVYTGSECTGYPSSFESFNCNITELDLYVEPKQSAFQVRLFSDLLDDDVCSPLVQVGLDITSVNIAHMYNMNIAVAVPDTNKIKVLSDSSYFQYNISNPYSSIDDPIYDEFKYQYNINDYEASFEEDGIPGALDLDNNRFRWRTTVSLEETFVNGDFIELEIGGENACGIELPVIELNYDPNTKFLKDNTAGLHAFASNTWSSSWGDYDGDGFDDLFVPNKDADAPSALYHNNGDGTMTKVETGPIASDLGESVSGTWGDYDNDGDLDLFVANNTYAKNKLYQNQGDGTFVSISDDPIVDLGVYSHSASWADYDRDGYLDMVISDIHPTHFNFLFRNKGDGSFEPVTGSVINETASSAVGVSWADYDNDNDPDLFIANTNGENNNLYRNDGGVFTQITEGDVVNDGGHSIGGTWGDYDNDGDLDLFVTNARDVEPNYFYENDGDGTFTKITSGVVLVNVGNSHGASWIDYDNDGDLDLIVANDQGNKNFLFANNGDKSFTKIVNAISEDESDSYGASWADYDNDGDYDLHISNHTEGTNDFFVNEKGACNNYFAVELKGCNSNFTGIGAKVSLKATILGKETWQLREISAQTGAIGGQNSLKTIFGINDASIIDSVVVQWPSGMIQVMTLQTANQTIVINEECGVKVCGQVFYDENENGVFDEEEKGIASQTISFNDEDILVYTNSDGYYQTYVNYGDYLIGWEEDESWVQETPADGGKHLAAILPGESEYCGFDFALKPTCFSPDLTLSVGTTAFRRGLTNDLTVTVSNHGVAETTVNPTLELRFTDNVYLYGDDWLSITEEDGYRTYTRLIENLNGLSDSTYEFIDSVSVDATLDEVVEFEATISTEELECDETNNNRSVFDVVVGSVDPNDKLVLVKNKGVRHQMSLTDTLQYTIRFQNVGNYAARRVFIVDTLSQWLDWSTFKVLESSHSFSVSVVDGVVTWVNNQIELPDSASNPEGSNGQVTFSIVTKQNVPAYEQILNKAGIQFDYNDFIITNTTKIILVPNGGDQQQGVFIYPNPATTNAQIMLTNALQERIEIDYLEVYNNEGRFMDNYQVKLDQFILPVHRYSSGTYRLVAYDLKGDKYSGTLIVR
ncbi:FG-GAP-like repeat-containing protein [Crocinitomix algicola]|uniref:FG-GAP-like repeat-containing protein n=1 Tax=Crocinitomix algicola TaxID=1740263 RepID=UPI0008720D70|nr:FG-GAP-like repeat-containing protein [Crocinitomix algicola]